MYKKPVLIGFLLTTGALAAASQIAFNHDDMGLGVVFLIFACLTTYGYCTVMK